MTSDTYYGFPMPVCPYCGYESRCVADLLKNMCDTEGEAVCEKCHGWYVVTAEVVHTFTTRKKDEA